MRKTIIINLNNIYFNTIERVICFRLIKETITILFILFTLNAKKKNQNTIVK